MARSTLIAVAGTVGALALGATMPSRALGHPTDDAKASAPAARPDDEILAPPPTYQANGVTVDEHVGARVPLDAKFRTQDGQVVSLGDMLRGELPTILTFNYSDCPMLCSVQLNGLTAALPRIGVPADAADPGRSDRALGTGPPSAPAGAASSAASAGPARNAIFRVGAQFRIVTIDLEPTEALDKARAMRDRYLDRLPEDQRAVARTGWTFLVAATPGDGAAIKRVADAVGFRYTYIPDRAEWAHPAALILLSASGVVTRYVYGIEFEPAMLRESIYKAGIAEPAAAVGFLLRCYHYDPGANSHARAGVLALQYGAAGFVVLLLSVLGVMHLARRGAKDKPSAPPPAPHGVT
jgi:protein SCO1/2